jgi:hypothetical protein
MRGTAKKTLLALAVGLGGLAGGATVSTSCGGSQAGDNGTPESGVPDGTSNDGPSSDAAASDGGPKCPSGRGPEMVRIPSPDGGTYCIDSTEVTNGQFFVFLSDRDAGPRASDQNPYCKGSSFDAGYCAFAGAAYDPYARGNYPIACANWCDAYSFCAWAGKHMCGAFGGGPVGPLSPDGGWFHTEWGWSCTSGGQFPELTPMDGSPTDPCNFGGLAPVATYPGCQSPDPAYAGVYDLRGNAYEWANYCIAFAADASISSYQGPDCVLLTAQKNCAWGYPVNITQPMTDQPIPYYGFRCCAE